MFAQPYNHSFDDLFNQYVNAESSGADGNKDSSYSGDLEQLFSLDSLSSDGGDHSPTGSTIRCESPQPWTKEWSLQDDGPSVDQFAFQDTVHPSAISDLGLNNFEVSSRPAGTTGVTTSPSTPPATPRRKAISKSALVTPKSIRHRDPNERRALMRKQSFSPSLMRSSIQKGRMTYPEAWAQRVQSFNLGGSDRLPLSPPPSDVIVQHENMAADTMNHTREPAEVSQYDAQLFHQSPAISMPSPSAGALARHQQQYMSHPVSSALTNSSPPSADDIFSSSHSSDPQSISSWQSDAFNPSLSFTPDLQGPESQWWSAMPSKVAQQQQSAYHTAPQQRMQSVGSQNDMMHGGLMIQMDPSFDMSTESSFSSSSMMHSNGQKFMTPYTAPRVQNISRSPSLSPKASSPKSTKGHRRTHSRKISGQSMSAPKSAKSSTSPRGSNKSVSVSFVNFTAHDSQKILGGVAPSGSSKTKARREQEARDRRRKLSEAALKAVRKAGGDVDALEAIFC
ncbi:uncharacterized protein N7498_009455 [Penicillium cinerascens]|uniref:Developmental regulatory protein wetA n=1 Tax=Penicillium cinerascens TaxID=70096 RepID=A0A9W9J8Y5_9EURO|nr:uncharacterized protein N7498_009455 [Penicillium cinerascens]KAJ5190470.1 hypothetical protein N7498_009455 [Penicillium cinerascens]